MYNNGNWGTDAELIAASALLQTDIYIANKIYHSEDSDEAEIRWSRIRASNNNNNNNNYALYITNYSNHYQPVTRMINSHTPTFFFHDTTPININQFIYLKLLLSHEHLQFFESAQRQGTSNLVGTSARGYSGNAIPIMVSPDIGNATCNGTSPVAKTT